MSLLQPFGGGRAADPGDMLDLVEGYETPLGQYLGARLDSGWWNSILFGQVAERLSLPDTALDALTEDPAEMQAVREIRSTPLTAAPPPFRRTEQEMIEARLSRKGIAYLTEDAWRASPDYRDMPFEPYMTADRAKAKAEVYDVNRYRDWLRQQRPGGVLTAVLGFGAELAGGLPDPINWVGFGGWASRGATLLRTMGRGAYEAGLLTAATSPLLAHNLAFWGDDMTFADAVLDIALGAATGGIFAGGGRVVRTLRDGRTNRQATALAEADAALDEAATLAQRAEGYDPKIAREAPAALERLNQTVTDLATHQPVEQAEPASTRLSDAGAAPVEAVEAAGSVTLTGKAAEGQEAPRLALEAAEGRLRVVPETERAADGGTAQAALYQRAAEIAEARGLRLESGGTVTPGQRQAYEALRRRGYEVTTTPGTKVREDGGLTAPEGKPALTVGRRRTPPAGSVGSAPPVRRAAPEAEALAEVAERAPDPVKDTEADPDVAAYQELEAAGAVRAEDAEAFKTASEDMVRVANIEKAYEQASICLARAGA